MPVVLLVAAAFVVLVLLRDTADPVSVDDAVTRYRDGAAGAAGGDERAVVGDPPPPGVYVYATDGSEGVDALGGSEHEYPVETTVTVSAGDDDCLTMRWAPLEQRWDEEVLCPEAGGGWSRRATVIYHSFFNQGETRASTCDAPGVVPAPDDDAAFTWTCSSEGSGRSGESHQDGHGEVIGVEPVIVGGVERRTLHVRYESEISGETSGSGTIDRWYALDRFPLVVREVKDESTSSETVIGTVRYHESYELVLTSWEPRR